MFSKALVRPQIPWVTFKPSNWKHSLQPPVISSDQEVSRIEKSIERYFINYINHYVSEHKWGTPWCKPRRHFPNSLMVHWFLLSVKIRVTLWTTWQFLCLEVVRFKPCRGSLVKTCYFKENYMPNKQYKRSWPSLDSFFWIPLRCPVWSPALVSRQFLPHLLQANPNRAVLSPCRWQEEVITKRKSYHSPTSIIFSSSVCLGRPCSYTILPCTS